MARLETPVDPSTGPLQSFAYELRKVRAAAGNPTYRALAKTAGYSATTLSEAARGERRPTLDVVLAYVGACHGDVEQWRRRWHALDEPPDATADVAPEETNTPNVRRRVLVAAAAILLATVVVTVVAKWPRHRVAPPVAAGCPQLPAKRAFTGETYGTGVAIRAGASTDAAVVTDVPARCTLGFTGYCRGQKMKDATSGTPDVRWFILGDGNVVPSAVIHGNPPAQLRPASCRGERPAPQAVTLELSADVAKPGAILARATGRDVDIVGFAARHADPGSSGSPQWQQIALSGGGEFTGTWRPGGPAASGRVTIVAAACLGGGGPTDVVDAKATSDGTPEAATLSPQERTAAARSACQYPAGTAPK
ncbi:helix-turn-helix transcriptional regulator [Dactylosporangium sp. NPDC049140]|uniref:helix-turn-helix domain-containing protein n=1 Tax=Dactylosporangium sp. NPDC049140 TaxID=3155647 RepID=UPI003401C433